MTQKKHVPVHIPNWEGLEIQARTDAQKAADAVARQVDATARNAVVLDAHRAVTYHPGGFVVGWEHSSWSDQ